MKNRLFACGILLILTMVRLSPANGQEAENQVAQGQGTAEHYPAYSWPGL